MGMNTFFDFLERWRSCLPAQGWHYPGFVNEIEYAIRNFPRPDFSGGLKTGKLLSEASVKAPSIQRVKKRPALEDVVSTGQMLEEM
ncbi:MAG: hypothetical protein KJ630_12730 [Proteobacteria bacterium]|nr:hypothetical protein [Pseudomonadota bacterium]